MFGTKNSKKKKKKKIDYKRLSSTKQMNRVQSIRTEICK